MSRGTMQTPRREGITDKRIESRRATKKELQSVLRYIVEPTQDMSAAELTEAIETVTNCFYFDISIKYCDLLRFQELLEDMAGEGYTFERVIDIDDTLAIMCDYFMETVRTDHYPAGVEFLLEVLSSAYSH